MSGRRLYIGRVPPQATRDDLESFFGGSNGKIADIRLMGGFAFIEYAELKDAEQVVAEFQGKEFMGERSLIIEFARPPRSVERGPPGGERGYGGRGGYDRPPPRGYDRGGYDRPPPSRQGGSGHRLLVNGVPDGVSWQDLKDFARSAGNVTFADLDRSQPGVAYIEYPSRADADDAIRNLSNTELRGSLITIEDAPAGAGPSRRDDYRPRYDDRRRDDYRDDRRRDDYRSDDRDRRRDDRDDRDRDYGRRRSPSPRRRERSPEPRESRDRSERERERSPVRERSDW